MRLILHTKGQRSIALPMIGCTDAASIHDLCIDCCALQGTLLRTAHALGWQAAFLLPGLLLILYCRFMHLASSRAVV